MSVYSFPLKDSGCFTVAYNRLLLTKILFYISMYWEMLETLLSIICYYCTIHQTYALLYAWTYF